VKKYFSFCTTKNDFLRYPAEIRKIMNKISTHFSCFIACESYSLLILLFIFSFCSCKKNDLVPAYIHIDHIKLASDYATDGSNSNKITDAWVYLDDDLIGIYELPATFPVLASGSHKISVRAGIKLNGIAMSRGYYPFYQSYTTNIDLQPEEIDSIIPEVSYFPDKIQWKEDFEDAGLSISKYGESDTAFIQTTDSADAFEGYHSAVAHLDATYKYILCLSNETFEIPQNQSPVFLELNYKTDTYLRIGMYGELASGTHQPIETMVLNPTTEWNKIYINMTLTANTTVNTVGFRVFFEAYSTESVPNPKIYLDNIKLLYNN
jgi:hypothetical protein